MRRKLFSALPGIHLVVVVISAISFEVCAEIDMLEATRIAEAMLLREEQVEGTSLEFEVTVVRGRRHSDWFNFLSDFTCEYVYDKEMRDKLRDREYLLVYFSSVDPEVDYDVGFFIDVVTAELIYVYRSTLIAP